MKNSEKRQNQRESCSVDSSFKNLDGSAHPATASFSETTIQDLSEGGVRFRSNYFVPIHNKLLFKIHIPNRKPIEALVQPAWIRELPSVHQFDIGGKFISLSEEDKEIIRQFTNSFLE